MKNKLSTWIKRLITFLFIFGISFFVLVMVIGGSDVINQDSFLSFILALLPFVVPIILGLFAAKRVRVSKQSREPTGGSEDVAPSGDEPSYSPVSKKPFYKRWWVWGVASIFLFVCYVEITANSSQSSASIAPVNLPSTSHAEAIEYSETTESLVWVPVETTIATEPKGNMVAKNSSKDIPPVEIVEALDPAAPTKIPSTTIADAAKVIGDVASTGFANYTVRYDDNLVSVDVWENGVASTIDAIAHGNSQPLKLWNELVDSYKSMSVSYTGLIADMGLANVSVAINLLNDANKENALLSVVDGVVVYNCLDTLTISETTPPTIPAETLSPREQLDSILATYDPADYEEERDYVLNTNTMKFHYPWCNSVDEIKNANRTDVTVNRSDLIGNGYKACRICNP